VDKEVEKKKSSGYTSKMSESSKDIPKSGLEGFFADVKKTFKEELKEKQLLEELKPEFERDDTLKNTLKYARIWTHIFQLMFIVVQIKHLLVEKHEFE
jgi:hypothetical protein